jgi:hypothetical protein
VYADRTQLDVDIRNFGIDKKVEAQKLICESEKVALVKELFTTVFRNTEIRSSILKNKTETPAGQNGSYPLESQASESETITHEKA